MYRFDYTGSPVTGNATVTVSSALTAGDVYVAIDIGTYDNTSQHGTALSGLGVSSWTRVPSAQSQFADVWIGTGTSDLGVGQTLTLTAPTLVSGYGYRSLIVYCFRGITATATGVTAAGSSTTVTTPDLTAGLAQAVIAFGITDLQANTVKDLVPATGWAAVENTQIYGTAIWAGQTYREPSAVAVHRASASRASGSVAVHLLRLGTTPTTGVIERIQVGPLGADASGTIPFETNLLATDVVIIAASRNSSGTATFTIDGVAAPLVGEKQNGTGATRAAVFAKSGMTGVGHGLTYNYPLSTAAAFIDVFVVRDLPSPLTVTQSFDGWDGIAEPAGTIQTASVTHASQNFVLQIAVSAGSSGANYPLSLSPATGWTIDRPSPQGTGVVAVMDQLMLTAGTSSHGISNSSFAQMGAWTLSFGPVSTLPPATDNGIWGVQL